MKRNKNAPTGPTDQGALSKNHTAKVTPNSPIGQQTIRAYQRSTESMEGLYEILNSPLMVTIDTPEARRAVIGFIKAWQTSRACFKADHDEAGEAYLDEAAAHANAIKRHSADIHLGGIGGMT